jgi:UDP-N-acetylglucosamine/UDP-N-acetylgalactosamine 4-epimerase
MPYPELQDRLTLVTGGAGFIGSHLIDALLERGARVRVIDDLSTGLAANLAHLEGRIDWQEADLRDLAACHAACRDVELVFHQAALGSVPRSIADPATTIDVNVGGTANLLAAAREAGVKRFVFASSSSVYGDSVALPKRESQEGEVLSPYALSKKICEQLAKVFGSCYGLETVGLRYFNVFGPRQRPDGPYAAVIPRFFAASRQGESPVIFGDGLQSRDFTYVADAVDANLLAAGASSAAFGQSFNIAGGRRVSVLDLAKQIRAIVGGPAPRFEPTRKGDVLHSLADLTKARASLGFEPKFGLEEGLRRTAAAFG